MFTAAVAIWFFGLIIFLVQSSLSVKLGEAPGKGWLPKADETRVCEWWIGGDTYPCTEREKTLNILTVLPFHAIGSLLFPVVAYFRIRYASEDAGHWTGAAIFFTPYIAIPLYGYLIAFFSTVFGNKKKPSSSPKGSRGTSESDSEGSSN